MFDIFICPTSCNLFYLVNVARIRVCPKTQENVPKPLIFYSKIYHWFDKTQEFLVCSKPSIADKKYTRLCVVLRFQTKYLVRNI